MTKPQRAFILSCSTVALIGSVGWWWKNGGFEPFVVLAAGLASLANIYWPFRPRYASSRLKGRAVFDYAMNNGVFTIGDGELRFDTQWSRASDTSIHCYKDQPSVAGIAIALGAASISDVRDASRFEMSSRSILAREGEIIVLCNNFGNYAAIRVADIRDRTREDTGDEISIEYAINPFHGTDFG